MFNDIARPLDTKFINLSICKIQRINTDKLTALTLLHKPRHVATCLIFAKVWVKKGKKLELSNDPKFGLFVHDNEKEELVK